MKLMSKHDGNESTVNKIVRLMQADESVDAPPQAIQWSKNIFRARIAEPKKSFVQRIAAILQIDLSPENAVFGERSASTGKARQMLFQAGENSLDLRIKKEEKGFSLRGQVLGTGFDNCAVKLTNGENVFQSETNELSEFGFAEIPRGKYDLVVQSGEREIVINGLELK